MASRVFRSAIYLLVIAALIFFGLAIAIEFGVRTIPLGPSHVIDLSPSNAAPIRIGLLVGGMAALLFMVERLRSR